MPYIFFLLPLLIVAKCHFSQLRKAAVINLHLLKTVFSWDRCSALAWLCDLLLFWSNLCSDRSHFTCKTRAPTPPNSEWCLGASVGERLRLRDSRRCQVWTASRGWGRSFLKGPSCVLNSSSSSQDEGKFNPTYVYAFHTHLEFRGNYCDCCIYHHDFTTLTPSNCEWFSFDYSISHSGSGTDVSEVRLFSR